LDEALAVLRDAVQIFHDIGDLGRQGHALENLGGILRSADKVDEAIIAYQEAAHILGDIVGGPCRGHALESLGVALREAGRLCEALAVFRNAIHVFQETGDQVRENRALNQLAAVQETCTQRECRDSPT
jgi:tetratricopeptide (TPR) repeat protein